MEPRDALALARWWAERGVPAFPAAIWWNDAKNATDKWPLTDHGHLDATADLATLARLFSEAAKGLRRGQELGVGIHLGPVGYIALDFDTKNGKAGGATLSRLLQEHPELASVRYRSASGALNVIVAKPPGLGTVSNVAPKDWHGTDVRGDSGWVVPPGTITTWGEWRWDEGSMELEDAWELAPEWAKLLREAKPGERPATTPELAAYIEARTRYTPAAQAIVDDAIGELARAGRGSRHEALVSAVARIVGLNAIDLADAMEQVHETWDKLTEGEGREREPMDALAWVVGQEQRKAAAVGDEPATDPLADVWEARPELAHIRTAAHSRSVSAPALLFDALGRVVAHTTPVLTIPPMVGSAASLNIIHVVVAPSGGGKSTSHGLGRELFEMENAPDVREQPPGSGEGLAECFMGLVSAPNPDTGRPMKVRQQVRKHALFYADEGLVVAQMAQRSGSTLLSQMRTAWSGDVLGQANASADTYRVLEPHSYRLCITIGIQSDNAMALLADHVSGTPQRLVWASAVDRSGPERWTDAPEWPGPLKWKPPYYFEMSAHMDVPESVAAEVRQAHLDRQRNGQADPLDAHRYLCRLKLAGALALLNGRYRQSVEDWQLAEALMAYSDGVRGRLVALAAERTRQRVEAQRAAKVDDQAAVDDNATKRIRESAIGSAARMLTRHDEADDHRAEGGGCTRRCITLAMAGKHRVVITVDEVIAALEHRGLAERESERLRPGPVKP